jgi:hypothetical protein
LKFIGRVIAVFLFIPMLVKADVGDELRAKSNALSSSFEADVASVQARMSKKLVLQLHIETLRNQIGAERDPLRRRALQDELNNLLKKRQNI